MVGIFSIVSVSLFSSFSMGLKVWKRAATLNYSQRKAILGLERLSMELRRTFHYKAIGFWGEKDRLEFASIFQDKIFNISYEYSPLEMCINRSALSLQQMLGQEKEAPARRVMGDVKNMSFSFYGFNAETGNFTFLDNWNYTKSGMPSAVKVSLTLEDGKGFEKIIVIPIAQ